MLGKILADAGVTEAIADATLAIMVDGSGVLLEPCEPFTCGFDGPQFKGIFIRYLAYLYDVDRKPAYFNFLFKNAHSIWFNDRDGSDHLGLRIAVPVAPSELLLGTPGYTFGLGFAVRQCAGIAGVPGSAGEFMWAAYAGTYFWVDPKEELVAVFMSRALIVSGVRVGFFSSRIATAPATTGVAMLVPLKRKYAGGCSFLE